MSWLEKIMTRLGGRKMRRTAEPAAFMVFLENSRWVTALIFCVTVVAIVIVSSAGLNTANLPVLPNQLATTRIDAVVPFNYASEIRTQQARAQIIERVPPVYRLEKQPLLEFIDAVHDLQIQVAELERSQSTKNPLKTELDANLTAAFDAFNARGPYRASHEDLKLLMTHMPTEQRAVLIEAGLSVLRQIYADGVHDDTLTGDTPGHISVLQVTQPDRSISVRHVQSLEEALTYLRINLAGEDVPRNVSFALFRVLRNGVVPNLAFDREATAQRQEVAVSQLKPVVVHVNRGHSIIEPGTRVTPEQYEMLMAHRKALRENTANQLDEDLQLFSRILLVLAMVLASVFYVRLEDRETSLSNGRLGLLALVVILNITLVRAVYSLGSLDFFSLHGDWASTLPYIAPFAFAPLIVAILIDAGSAIFMALFISIFTGVIYGNRLDLLVLTFLASTVAIFSCQDVRKRSRVVRSAGLGGLTIALFALLVGLADQLPLATLLKQFGAGLTSGVLTGIIVVGLLPVLESLFKRTTDITLLELTDYNHPLLRLMQLEAPGTYHHSLVVAQLSENAASAIGANPLLARVCALFHDVGKTVKPEYFIENQRTRENPHDLNNPSLSALIIKSHVKEGVDLARQHRLPRAVIDVIRQHHGTTLIRFFYHRAVTTSQGNSIPARRNESRELYPPGLGPMEVAESTYRYDGPVPRFKESAIISLADGVEAASRSLRKVTPQHMGELIDSIIRDRIEDEQMDESLLTFAEITRIKSSFNFTMLNMLHSRVNYPAGTEPEAPAPKG
ncbi:MAG: HDIG domain-containing protein [Cephaloticoccus sp.]|nr:HDIG domain-containing protein [Cephaloticoccus sp.]MCF7761773.1 HDIG domain-containing protein [Cephaloticoccus sp.]